MRELPARLWCIYRHDLPRVIRELRWLILALALVEIIGTWLGYRAAIRASFDAMMKNPDGVPPFAGLRLPMPFVPELKSQVPAWYAYLGTNSLVAAYGWCYAAISGGAYALYTALYSGWHRAWVVAGSVPTVRAASGLGLTGAAATLLPHGLIETPVFVFARALALRAGLSWFWRVPGYGRWASVKHQGREFRRMLMVIVPLLLVAGVLEAYPAQYLRDRYLLGVGLSRELVSERRVHHGRNLIDGIERFAVSPDGRTIAVISGKELRTGHRHARGSKLLLEAAQVPLSGPSWSPDGKRIAVLSAPYPKDEHSRARSELLLIDVGSGAKQVLVNERTVRCDLPSWSPAGDEIAVRGLSLPRDASRRKPNDLWIVAAKTGEWRQVTHLPASTSVSYGQAGPAWSPDGRQLAFTRRGKKEDTHNIWLVGADGAGLRQLAHGARDASPAWSPDGKWIAFVARPSFDVESAFPERFMDQKHEMSQVCLIRADGTGRVDGVAKTDGFTQIQWARDGRSLYYTRMLTLIEGSPRVLATR